MMLAFTRAMFAKVYSLEGSSLNTCLNTLLESLLSSVVAVFERTWVRIPLLSPVEVYLGSGFLFDLVILTSFIQLQDKDLKETRTRFDIDLTGIIREL